MHSGRKRNIAMKRKATQSQRHEKYHRNVVYDEEYVTCLYLPSQWPDIARTWKTRRRPSGWPDSDTIRVIVQKGYHLVHAAHRDGKPNNTQWRISFSPAEVILLRSWTTIQQIIYHMLRFVIKHELKSYLDTDVKDGVLSMYHIKTLMMWSCETYSQEWWLSADLVCRCCELLHKLAERLEQRHCSNYFIEACNLFGHKMDDDSVQQAVLSLRQIGNASNLAGWFVENYLRKVFIDEGRITEAIIDSDKSHSNFLDYLRNEVKNDHQTRLKAIYCSKFLEKFIYCDLICDELLSKYLYNGKLKFPIEKRFTSEWYLQRKGELHSVDILFSEYWFIINALYITNQIRYTNITEILLTS